MGRFGHRFNLRSDLIGERPGKPYAVKGRIAVPTDSRSQADVDQ